MILAKCSARKRFCPVQIYRKDVDNFKPGQCFPDCELIVEWDLEDHKPVRLRYMVELKGAKDLPFFNLNLNPKWKGSL